MNPVIEVKQQTQVEALVRECDLAAHFAESTEEAYPEVWATPSMIALMERACAKLLRPLLKEGEMSVGAMVHVTHMAPTSLGSKVSATATYQGREGRLFLFNVSSSDAHGEVGRGIHSRAIVSRKEIVSSAQQRTNRL